MEIGRRFAELIPSVEAMESSKLRRTDNAINYSKESGKHIIITLHNKIIFYRLQKPSLTSRKCVLNPGPPVCPRNALRERVCYRAQQYCQ
jgi:hypothetical protein